MCCTGPLSSPAARGLADSVTLCPGCAAVALLHQKSYPRVGFSPLFLCALEVATIVPSCFFLLFWQLLLVVGRVRFLMKPTFLRLAVCLRDWRVICASDLMGDLGYRSTERRTPCGTLAC